MPHYNLALLGFGNVGQSLARLLLRKQEQLKSELDITFSVTGIASRRHGMAVLDSGLDLQNALFLIASDSRLNSLSNHPPPATPGEFIDVSGANVLFESTPVNYETGQPAVSYLRRALQVGMHAITANKGPVVHAYRELTALAAEKGLKFYFESAVMDGAPIFSLFRETLPLSNLRSLRGILNSTTNLILMRMEGGESLSEAIAYAQSIGITETDPSGDIDGWDAAVKISALVTVLMGVPLLPSQVERSGIRNITRSEIAKALSAGKRWKLLCSAWRDGDKVQARVGLQKVGMESPFYSVDGTSSCATFETDTLTQLTIVEGNPGPDTTAYGMLADFINAVRK